MKGQQKLPVFQHPVLLAKKESWWISGGVVFIMRLWSGPGIRSCKCVFPKLPTHANLGSPYTHFGTVNPLDQTCGIKLPFNGPTWSRRLPQPVHGGGAWVGILLGVATLLCTGGCGPGCSSRVPDIALGVSGFFHLYIRDVVETKPCKVAELRSVLALHIGPSQGGPTLHLRTSHVTTRRRTHFVGKAAPLRECSKRDSGRWQGGCTVPAA